MSDRLVVCLRYAAVECEPEHFLVTARRVEAALSAVGGERIAWGADRYSFELDEGDFALALRQLIAMLLEHPEHGVGVSAGPLEGAPDGPWWGRPLVVANALAGGARPGEILLDPSLREVQTNRVEGLGRMPVRVGERYLGAILVLPGTCSLTGLRGDASSASAPAPEGRPSVFDALRSGDPKVMLPLSKALRDERRDSQTAVRLEAMALISQGDIEQGLAQLQGSVEQSVAASPIVRSQATLALAVGYLQAGQRWNSGLTAIRALEQAKRSGNARAEQACSQLLAQLAAQDRCYQVARGWQRRASELAES